MNHLLKILEENVFFINIFNKFIKKIDECQKRKIIIVGPRCSGKTILINKYIMSHSLKNDFIICPNFNKISNLLMTEEEKKIEIEFILCEELLNYINSDIKLNFYKKIILKFKTELYNRCISRIHINNDLFLIEKGFLIETLLNEISKEHIYENSILIIDNFDWIKDSSKNYQNMLIEFFPFFSKSIIVSEDETIFDNFKYKELEKKGYDIINLNYTKELLVLKKLITLKMRSNKCVSINVYNLLKDNIIFKIIELSEGNLDIIFYIIDKISDIKIVLNEESLIIMLEEFANEKKEMYKIICKKKLQI